MGISTSTGLGTGLDLTGLVNQLVAAEGKPVYDALKARETSANAKLSALGSVKSALSTLNDAVKALGTTSSIASQNATLSDTTRATVSAGAGAVSGKYSLEITALAQPASVTSSAYASTAAVDPSGNGTFGLTMADGSTFSVPIGTTDTLAKVRDAINNASNNPGVTATLVNGDDGAHLLVSSNKTGTANAFTANGSLSIASTVAAVDAQVKVNGTTLTRSTNTITDAVDGLTLNLQKTTDAGAPLSLTVASDNAAITSKMNALVTAYNNLTTVLKSNSGFDATGKTLAPLAGDAMVQSLQRSIRQNLTDPVSGGSAGYTTLASLGLNIDRYGVMSLDTAKLNTAIKNGGSVAMSNLLGSSTGVATRLNSYLSGYLTGASSLTARTDSINKNLKAIASSRLDEDDRLTKLQATLSKQFQAMDSAVSKINSTGTYLTKVFG